MSSTVSNRHRGLRCLRGLAMAFCLALYSAMSASAEDDAPAVPITLSEEEQKLGFELIFNGTSDTGWQHKGNWVVQDGTLWRNKRGGDITYTAARVPDDFELRFEWKVSKGCNSGVYYRPGQYEYQILDDANSPYGENPRQSAASLFFCMAPSKDVTRPHGQWNTARIVCKGTVIQHWLNGEKVIDFDYTDPRWSDQVKLLRIRGADLSARGANLRLQDHGADVWFRMLRWRAIPADEELERSELTPLPIPEKALQKERERVKRMLEQRKSEARRLPNIVVIMADDLGYGDLACYGQRRFPTPHTDRLARKGMRFTDAHSPSAICSPTRYAVVTGTDPFRRYHTSHVLFNGEPLVIGRDQPTIASLLKQKGYRTGVVGKWHLGLGDTLPRDLNLPGRGPNQVGFDYSYLVPDGHNMLPHYYLENGTVVGGTAKPFHSQPAVLDRVGYKLVQNQPLGQWANRRPADQIGARLTEKAVAFIEQNKDRPFFLYFPTCSIHTPHKPDPRFRGNSGIGPHGDYVMEFDWTVGQVMETLDRLELSEDTLLIVTSDNGGLNEKNGHNPNRPWHGMKGSAFEGGHRVPMIARWPGRTRPGSVCDETISLVDLTATCCAIAKISLPANAALDSFNLLPLLLDEAATAPIRPYTVMGTRGMEELVLRQGPWKLIVSPEDDKTQLYHLGHDPGESQDLSATHVEKRKELRDLLTQYITTGSSRSGAEASGTSFEAIFRERDERNQQLKKLR